MKAVVKKLAIRLKSAPVIGKLMRFAIAVYRLPRSRAELLSILVPYREQLPALLETISKLNRRQYELDRDIPVALRTLRRDMGGQEAALRSELNSVRPTIEGLLHNVDYLLKRVEFVRRELMFEMRYGAKNTTTDGDRLEVQPKVIATDKLAAARADKVRLNLGCGHVPLGGYLNVDRRELPGVDIVAELSDLPFGQKEIDEIYSAHVLEHFPQEQLRRQLLPYWKSLLKPGGVFRAVVPDAEAMIREYSAGRYPYEYMREVFYGAQDYDGDFHYNMFIPCHLADLLAEAGFEDTQIIEAGRRNDICFEFEIAAKCAGEKAAKA